MAFDPTVSASLVADFNAHTARMTNLRATQLAARTFVASKIAEAQSLLAQTKALRDAFDAKLAAVAGSVVTLFDIVNVEGNSISQSAGNNPNAWPKQLQALLGSGVVVTSYALSSTTLNQMKDNWYANDHSGSKFVAGKRNLVILGPSATNDFTQDNANVVSLQSYLKTFSDKARATGYKGTSAFWDSTELPRRVEGSYTADMESRRVALNNWKRANWQTYCDYLIDFDSVVTLSMLYDGIHPGDESGARVMAQFVLPRIKVTTSTGAPASDSIITTNGTIDMSKWAAMAAKLSRADGIAYRKGAPAPAITGKPTYFQPGNHPWPENIVGTHSGEWQLGTFRTYDGTFQGGDFASNIAWSPYVADDPAKRIGLIEFQSTSTDHGTFTQKPEPSWARYKVGTETVDDAEEALYWKRQGVDVRNPVCSANTLDRPGWGTQTITFFQDGFWCTTGANTMTNKSSGRLPAGLVPSACCVTGANGICLVTCWDVPNQRAVLGVVLLCGLGANATLSNPGGSGDWWGEWVEPHPGLHNLGNIVFSKFIGSIVLPGMVAPTEVSATTHHSRFGYLDGSPGEPSCRNQTFLDSGGEARRQEWLPGRSLERAYVKQAECIVISKTERMSIWVDLKPIYTFINGEYFNADRNRYLATTNIGLNAGQWPFTFDERPQQKPTVTKTFTYDKSPTAVFMAPYSYREEWRQAWIGFEDGTVLVYNTGGVNDTGNAAAKVQVGSFNVGANPTRITWVKEKARSPSTQANLVKEHTRQLVICVRGEAAIKWYDMSSSTTTASLLRVAQETRMIDPIDVVDTDNHGGEHYVVTVADYAGRKVSNIRYGDMIMWTYPEKTRLTVGANGTDPFEWCGSYPIQGYPFGVGSANVS